MHLCLFKLGQVLMLQKLMHFYANFACFAICVKVDILRKQNFAIICIVIKTKTVPPPLLPSRTNL